LVYRVDCLFRIILAVFYSSYVSRMSTVLITGGTGLVGTHLSKMLIEKGYKVIILSRVSKQSDHANLSYASWNVTSGEIDIAALKKADHIIHLAGAGVADKRWSSTRKKEIQDSRIDSAKLVVKALKEIPNNIQTVVSASAIGWYGPDTKQSRSKGFSEDAPPDNHFLGETCRLWETSIDPVTEVGKRLVKFRIGIVLAENGGALKEFSKPVKFGIATIMGNGEQVVSWIHVEDLCRMFIHAIENKNVSGVYNAVAPQPVTNKELILTIAKKLRGKHFIPIHVPSFILKIVLGEMSIEVLKSATVSSEKIKKTGFSFLYPTLRAALHLK
jgi:uncharacterized protein